MDYKKSYILIRAYWDTMGLMTKDSGPYLEYYKYRKTFNSDGGDIELTQKDFINCIEYLKELYFEKGFGETIEYEGKQLILSQFPYVDTIFENFTQKDVYQAHAFDRKGNHYVVQWDILNKECEDESESCNWDIFKVIKI